MKEIPTEIAFCTYVIQKNETLIIPDAKEDPSYQKYPAVTSLNIRFYTGIPLQIADIPVGTLCVMDNSSNRLRDEQLSSLKILGKQIVSQLNLRLKHKELNRSREREKHLIAIVSHELRTPLTSVFGTLTLLRSDKLNFSDEKKGNLLDSCYRNTSVLK